MVPLSEHEQRLLTQMEEQLLTSDPRFAQTMRGTTARAAIGKRLTIGAIALVVGIALLGLGLWKQTPLVGVLGFAVMLTGTVYAVSGPFRHKKSREAMGGVTAPSRSQGTFIQRMEDRWEKRRYRD